ncbi:MAG: aminoacyl-tRNA hydrolase [Flavobacteriaceae bacterium]|nr:aminoacyl-tRNA hydrolase [Bacteroidia bacterium]NNL16449.1 aminoacyl-tRNA hydrolase [Flavobacteriaceae bacterium]
MGLNLLIPELKFKAIRSSGSGGQHVNKVSSKIELNFDLENSSVLSNDQKEILLKSLKTKLTNNNELILQCDESRSQHRNKEIVIKRFLSLIKEGLHVPKKRRPTKIPKSAIKKRLKGKRIRSEKKVSRKKPDLE